MEESTQGIVLKIFHYKESERIATVFSKEHGMISLLFKRAQDHAALATPLCEAEFLYRKGKSDLLRFCDGTILDLHLALRSDIAFLRAAGAISQALLKSQLPGKPAPQLYALLSLVLKKIPLQSPEPLVDMFYLKLLTHEGGICWEAQERFPLPLTQKEWEEMRALALCRSFKEIECMIIGEELRQKIRACHHVLHGHY